MELLLKSTRP